VRPAGPPVEGAARRRRYGGVRLDDAGGPLGALVGRPTIMETTALGAAYLVGLQSASIPIHRRSQRAGRSTAAMDETTRTRRIVAWKHTSAARWAAMTLHARHRMPAVHFMGGIDESRPQDLCFRRRCRRHTFLFERSQFALCREVARRDALVVRAHEGRGGRSRQIEEFVRRIQIAIDAAQWNLHNPQHHDV
jgi:hypothetical protein